MPLLLASTLLQPLPSFPLPQQRSTMPFSVAISISPSQSQPQQQGLPIDHYPQPPLPRAPVPFLCLLDRERRRGLLFLARTDLLQPTPSATTASLSATATAASSASCVAVPLHSCVDGVRCRQQHTSSSPLLLPLLPTAIVYRV
ncbi:hypothetical protein BHE74_00048065 [Ensete ventricosum]|nr:hypothetical protein BHE74_00048065 [Ensete ventricosum]